MNQSDFFNVTVIQSRAVKYLMSKLRDKNTKNKQFMIYGDRLMRILAEEALCRLPNIVEDTITTPCGKYQGLTEYKECKVCLVSIVRSGDILQEAVRQLHPGVKVGKILIQRDEQSPLKNPVLYYKKFPKDISSCFVILVDPMLATAGSSLMAISELLMDGVVEENIMFLNLVCAPEGLNQINTMYPRIKIVTGAIDESLNENKFIVPGLGDYGDRYYGTD